MEPVCRGSSLSPPHHRTGKGQRTKSNCSLVLWVCILRDTEGTYCSFPGYSPPPFENKFRKSSGYSACLLVPVAAQARGWERSTLLFPRAMGSPFPISPGVKVRRGKHSPEEEGESLTLLPGVLGPEGGVLLPCPSSLGS